MEPALPDFHWQACYGEFSVSQSNVGQVRQYIPNQDRITGSGRSKTSFASCCVATNWNGTNGMFGIETGCAQLGLSALAGPITQAVGLGYRIASRWAAGELGLWKIGPPSRKIGPRSSGVVA